MYDSNRPDHGNPVVSHCYSSDRIVWKCSGARYRLVQNFLDFIQRQPPSPDRETIVVSDQDRERWNRRYHDGSYSARTYPSPFLVKWHQRLQLSPPKKALDIGCGAGRNSLFLAQQGHSVTGCDISKVALTRAGQSASEQHLQIDFNEMDFDQQIPPAKSWDLVVMIRFMNRNIQPNLARLLRPGGVLLAEHHVTTDRDVHGPQPPDDDRFRLRPNELLGNCADLHIIHYSEHRQIDADNRNVVLAQLVASAAALHLLY